MRLATEGRGADEDAVKSIVASAAKSRGEQKWIDAVLARTPSPGDPVGIKERAELRSDDASSAISAGY